MFTRNSLGSRLIKKGQDAIRANQPDYAKNYFLMAKCNGVDPSGFAEYNGLSLKPVDVNHNVTVDTLDQLIKAMNDYNKDYLRAQRNSGFFKTLFGVKKNPGMKKMEEYLMKNGYIEIGAKGRVRKKKDKNMKSKKLTQKDFNKVADLVKEEIFTQESQKTISPAWQSIARCAPGFFAKISGFSAPNKLLKFNSNKNIIANDKEPFYRDRIDKDGNCGYFTALGAMFRSRLWTDDLEEYEKEYEKMVPKFKDEYKILKECEKLEEERRINDEKIVDNIVKLKREYKINKTKLDKKYKSSESREKNKSEYNRLLNRFKDEKAILDEQLKQSKEEYESKLKELKGNRGLSELQQSNREGLENIKKNILDRHGLASLCEKYVEVKTSGKKFVSSVEKGKIEKYFYANIKRLNLRAINDSPFAKDVVLAIRGLDAEAFADSVLSRYAKCKDIDEYISDYKNEVGAWSRHRPYRNDTHIAYLAAQKVKKEMGNIKMSSDGKYSYAASVNQIREKFTDANLMRDYMKQFLKNRGFIDKILGREDFEYKIAKLIEKEAKQQAMEEVKKEKMGKARRSAEDYIITRLKFKGEYKDMTDEEVRNIVKYKIISDPKIKNMFDKQFKSNLNREMKNIEKDKNYLSKVDAAINKKLQSDNLQNFLKDRTEKIVKAELKKHIYTNVKDQNWVFTAGYYHNRWMDRQRFDSLFEKKFNCQVGYREGSDVVDDNQKSADQLNVENDINKVVLKKNSQKGNVGVYYRDQSQNDADDDENEIVDQQSDDDEINIADDKKIRIIITKKVLEDNEIDKDDRIAPQPEVIVMKKKDFEEIKERVTLTEKAIYLVLDDDNNSKGADIYIENGGNFARQRIELDEEHVNRIKHNISADKNRNDIAFLVLNGDIYASKILKEIESKPKGKLGENKSRFLIVKNDDKYLLYLQKGGEENKLEKIPLERYLDAGSDKSNLQILLEDQASQYIDGKDMDDKSFHIVDDYDDNNVQDLQKTILRTGNGVSPENKGKNKNLINSKYEDQVNSIKNECNARYYVRFQYNRQNSKNSIDSGDIQLDNKFKFQPLIARDDNADLRPGQPRIMPSHCNDKLLDNDQLINVMRYKKKANGFTQALRDELMYTDIARDYILINHESSIRSSGHFENVVFPYQLDENFQNNSKQKSNDKANDENLIVNNGEEYDPPINLISNNSKLNNYPHIVSDNSASFQKSSVDNNNFNQEALKKNKERAKTLRAGIKNIINEYGDRHGREDDIDNYDENNQSALIEFLNEIKEFLQTIEKQGHGEFKDKSSKNGETFRVDDKEQNSINDFEAMIKSTVSEHYNNKQTNLDEDLCIKQLNALLVVDENQENQAYGAVT